MGLYSVGGRHGAAAASTDTAAALWNPHASERIYVLEISWALPTPSAASPRITVNRINGRGTPASTVTPTENNSWDGDQAPPSGAVLDLAAYSALPTLSNPPVWRTFWPAISGVGCSRVFMDPGLVVQPGTGLAVANAGAVIFEPGDISFTWREFL